MICRLQETHTKENTEKLKLKGEKRYGASTNQNKAGVALLDNINFMSKSITKNKEGHSMMI